MSTERVKCDRCGGAKRPVMLTMRTVHNTTQVYLCETCLNVLRHYWKTFMDKRVNGGAK